MNFNDYQLTAKKTAIFPADKALAYLALGLTGEAGEVAEKVKKIIRDEGGYLGFESRVAIAKELGDVLWYMAVLSEYCGFDLSSVAEMNLKKLKDRQERNKLKGSGDNR